MLYDDSGQGFLEYIILVTLAVAASVAFVALYRAIRNRAQESANAVESMDLSY